MDVSVLIFPVPPNDSVCNCVSSWCNICYGYDLAGNTDRDNGHMEYK